MVILHPVRKLYQQFKKKMGIKKQVCTFGVEGTLRLENTTYYASVFARKLELDSDMQCRWYWEKV